VTTKSYPLVSIVTPAYNQAEYLAETIESVLAQDYPNIEYIVLDDGSTDHTRQVLARYNGRVRWESHPNMGQAKTLNKGWAMSKGEILAYLSSDDCLKENAVSEAVKALEENSNVIVTYSDYYLINNKSEIIREFQAPSYAHGALVEELICQPGPGAFFRRKIFDDLGGWHPELRQIPDFEFWLRASRLGEFLRIEKLLAYSRIHESSQSFAKTAVERAEEPVKVLMQFWAENHQQLARFNRRRSIANSYLLTARLHLTSGRFRLGAGRLLHSIANAPGMLFSVKFWRISLVAILRRFYYSRLLK
jgi:glycosyltransferase involved in cell wall biosynthesis